LPLWLHSGGIFGHVRDAARASRFYCGKIERYDAIMIALAGAEHDHAVQARPEAIHLLPPSRLIAGSKSVDQRRPITSEFTSLLDAPPAMSAEWGTVSLHMINETPLYAKTAFTDHAFGLYRSGRHRILRKVGRQAVEGWTDPGTINLMPPGIEGTWEAEASSRATVLLMPQAFLSRVIVEHYGIDSGKVEIAKQFLIRDPVIEGIMMNLAAEMGNGAPSGRLYAESACEYLAHHIVRYYSSISGAALRSGPVGGLPPRRLKRVLEYIEDNLGGSIGLRQLANLAGVSPRHFERAFRQSLDIPPYAYVLERRLQVARDLLVGKSGVTIGEIAMQLGFSSASHLSSAFRRRIGCSPSDYRKLHAR
jgi:AraC family transcriptional regulator